MPKNNGWVHRMLDKDLESETGTCSSCGPVNLIRVKRGGSCEFSRRIKPENKVRHSRPEPRRHKYKSSDLGIVYLSQSVRLKMWTDMSTGHCDICDKAFSFETACLDHDHATGRFRGWLCRRCNSSLGVFGDTVEGLQKAIAYLEK